MSSFAHHPPFWHTLVHMPGRGDGVGGQIGEEGAGVGGRVGKGGLGWGGRVVEVGGAGGRVEAVKAYSLRLNCYASHVRRNLTEYIH